MHRDIPTVRYNQSFSSAFQMMQECDCPALPVVNEWDELVGLISSENIADMILVQHAIGENRKRLNKIKIT